MVCPTRGTRKKATRVGRGEGSGKGKTSGRGTKGTRARNKVPLYFEGGQMPLYRRIPKLKGFKNPTATNYGGVNVGALGSLDVSDVGPEEMRAAGLVRKREKLVKVLGGGELSKKLTVRAHAFSGAARQKIESAGGTVEVIPQKTAAPKGRK
ncbi:MAG TPA: 50S ribosomal protein L15 [Actinomycetota bacterium]|nr:50S ribosomal protein L15 [Actinomycetota bacterium]